MGHSQADKALSRERILREAADQVRDIGLESISVGTLMRSAGLTHGGFYNHFNSRAELLALALDRALIEGRKARVASEGSSGRPRTLRTTVRNFLSRAHRDARTQGCAVVALASDVARADPASRAVMSRHVDDFIADIQALSSEHDEGDALLTVSAMVGALLLARVHVDARRSDALLRLVRERLLALDARSHDEGEA